MSGNQTVASRRRFQAVTWFLCLGLVPFSGLHGAYCNEIGIDDAQEISDDSDNDCDGNGFQDECDLQPHLVAVDNLFLLQRERIFPLHFVVDDFDGDHRNDLIASDTFHEFTQGIRLVTDLDSRLMDDPTAAPPTRIEFGSNTNVRVTADFDGDGDIDIRGDQFFLVNQGVDGFDRVATEHPPAIDVNNDDRVDILGVASRKVLYLRNDGDLNSSPVDINPGDPSRVLSLTTLDWNQDNAVDLLIGGYGIVKGEMHLSIWLNSGTGSFETQLSAPWRALTISGLESPIVAGDIDGDRDNDVVAFQTGNGQIQVYENHGEASLPKPRLLTFPDVPSITRKVMARDLNGDRLVDFLVSDENRIFEIFFNINGNFPDSGVPVLLPTSVDVKIYDANNDEIPDLFSIDPVRQAVMVQLNDGTGNFAPPVPVAIGGHPGALRLENIDADGTLDSMCAAGDSGNLIVSLGSRPTRILKTPDIASAELNGDDLGDLVSVQPTSPNAAIFLSTGPTEYAEAIVVPLPWPPVGVTAEDVVGSTSPDFIVAGNVILETGEVVGRVGIVSDSGTNYELSSELAVGEKISRVETIDLDGNGQTEVIALGVDLYVLTVSSNGELFLDQTLVLGAAPGDFLFVDVDGNSTLDVATTQPDIGELTVFLNDGTGRLQFDSRQSIDMTAEILRVADLDQDGVLDLVAENGDGALHVFLGKADGGFSKPTVLEPRGLSPVNDVALADRDSDGDLDWVVLGRGQSSFRGVRGHDAIRTIRNDLIPQFSPDSNENGILDGCEGYFVRGDNDSNGQMDL